MFRPRDLGQLGLLCVALQLRDWVHNADQAEDQRAGGRHLPGLLPGGLGPATDQWILRQDVNILE